MEKRGRRGSYSQRKMLRYHMPKTAVSELPTWPNLGLVRIDGYITPPSQYVWEKRPSRPLFSPQVVVPFSDEIAHKEFYTRDSLEWKSGLGVKRVRVHARRGKRRGKFTTVHSMYLL
jgi:hypothetical protein